MIPDYKPIIFNVPEHSEIEVFFAHDIHHGSDISDMKKWDRFKKDILSEPNRYIIWVGDYCEVALANSKSNIYAQTKDIECQRMWMEQQFFDLKERTIAIVPGNHENRINKLVGLFPVYDAAVCAGVADKYRQHFAFCDIGVGDSGKGANRQQRYVGYIVHRLRDCKGYNGADFIDGIDFAAYGHDHDPKDHARSKLVYLPSHKCVVQRDVEIVDSGSFMSYGSYGADNGYRPQSTKLYKMVLSGTREKRIKTIGYHI